MMVTSSSEKGHAKKFLEAGFAAYLVKPVRATTLHDSIAAVLNRSRNGKQPEQLVTRHMVNELRAASQQPDAAPGTRWSVLLAEDNLVNQKVATRLLEKLNLQITIAQNGQEAIDKAQSGAYDLIFMDCQMPEVDGYEATEAIRKMDGGKNRIPIVAMTANAMQGDREKCIGAGMDDYLTKPIKAAELGRMVDEWAPKGRAIRRDNGLIAADAGQPAAPKPVPGSGASNGTGNNGANGTHKNGRFDLDRLRMLKELLGGQDSELCQELLDPFVLDSETIFQNLRSAIAGQDSEKVEAGAHRLKGSCGNLGAMKLMESCGTLMKMGRAKSLQGAETVFTQMEGEFAELKAHLVEIRTNGLL
jgi:CheY-like chemotaxis protein